MDVLPPLLRSAVVLQPGRRLASRGAVKESLDRGMSVSPLRVAGGPSRRYALHTVFVDDLDERVESIAARGVEPASQETYENGVRKVICRDPDGNEIGFGGIPLE